MDYELFNQAVIEYKNSLISMGVVTLVVVLIGTLAIEFYVRGSLGCRFFEIGKLKISPTLLVLIPIALILIIYSIKIYECDVDVREQAYVEYIGQVKYSESSVKLIEDKISIYVGKWSEKVPEGTSYGKVIYSKRSKVIVFYKSLERSNK